MIEELIKEYQELARTNKAVEDLYEDLIRRIEADIRWARTIPKEKKND